MLEYLCFDFAPFGSHDKAVNSLEDFLHYIDAHDAVEEFPLHSKFLCFYLHPAAQRPYSRGKGGCQMLVVYPEGDKLTGA